MNAMFRKLAFAAALFAVLLLTACQDMGMKPMAEKSCTTGSGEKAPSPRSSTISSVTSQQTSASMAFSPRPTFRG